MSLFEGRNENRYSEDLESASARTSWPQSDLKKEATTVGVSSRMYADFEPSSSACRNGDGENEKRDF